VKYLAIIDRLKSRLIEPSGCEKELAGTVDCGKVTSAYKLYEQEMRRINVLDFNSLILESYRLLITYPAIAARYRKSYPHWLIDEFQDTNSAQYKLVRSLAGTEFQNLFAVADDDQIIYEWNGASFKQIQCFLSDYSAQVIQLPTNYRCPEAIVEAANHLVVYNAQRTSSKKPLIAGKTELRYPPSEHIRLLVFETDEQEAAGISTEIAERGHTIWGQTAVLARTKALLEQMNIALHESGVPSVIAQRRDDFLSAQFRWLVAVLRQFTRPLDRRNLAVLIEAFNRLTGISVSVKQVIAAAETTGKSYLTTWIETASASPLKPSVNVLLTKIAAAAGDLAFIRATIDEILGMIAGELNGPDPNPDDLAEDLAAWKEITHDIANHLGKNPPLDQFLQELQLRSKEPTPKPGTVTLMTIHGAKGREFDFVYVVGLAEDIMPSFQSKKKGNTSPEMEEERRNCFVAITRTKECLVLSRGESYRGWKKAPSRFLVEMGLASSDEGN
jgi:DNA helicase-2/ATP-dependent DNA helicase PcrA